MYFFLTAGTMLTRLTRSVLSHRFATFVAILLVIIPLSLSLMRTDTWKYRTSLSKETRVFFEDLVYVSTLIVIGIHFIRLAFYRWKAFDDIRQPACTTLHRSCVILSKCPSSSMKDRAARDEYAKHIGDVVRQYVHPDASWVDIMVSVPSDRAASSGRLKLTPETPYEASPQWLVVIASEIPRTTKPRLIPIAIRGRPWRGSGAAFFSHGIDYVDHMASRMPLHSYALNSPQEAPRILEQYKKWERDHAFASLVSLAITSSSPTNSAIGVLNIHFETKCPFGRRDALTPTDAILLKNTLQPHLAYLAHMIDSLEFAADA